MKNLNDSSTDCRTQTVHPPDRASPVYDEINRLHEEAVRQTAGSRQCLNAALLAAWQAGRLLIVEKRRIRRTMGAAWGLWLNEKFHGTHRTAQNYMRLAENTPDISGFSGLSLRQVYLRLGIATEPKSRTDSPLTGKLPSHIRLANKLLAELGSCDRTALTNPEQGAAYRQDLRALYERLRRLFESEKSAKISASPLSTGANYSHSHG